MNVIYRFIETTNNNIFWKYLTFLKMTALADEDEEEKWEDNLVQPPRKSVCWFPRKMKIHPPCDARLPLLDIYSKNAS